MMPLGLVMLACGIPESAPDLPSAPFVAGDARALGALVEPLDFLVGSPLAQHASAAATTLASCEVAHGLGEAPLGALACGEPEELAAARAEAPVLVGVPAGSGVVLARGGPTETGARFALEAWNVDGLAAMALPDAEPAGPAVLAAEGSFLHVRVRSRDGIDVASLIEVGSQADEMFGLRSALFSAAVLDGTWELAAWPPEPGTRAPLAALALGTRSADLAEEAVAALLDQLKDRWPSLRPTWHGQDGLEGGCLLDLNLLPELAPCWLVTPRAVVAGWNRDSLRLAAGDAEVPSLRIDLDTMAVSDELLHAVLEPEVAPIPLAYPWRELVLELDGSGPRPLGTLELR